MKRTCLISVWGSPRAGNGSGSRQTAPSAVPQGGGGGGGVLVGTVTSDEGPPRGTRVPPKRQAGAAHALMRAYGRASPSETGQCRGRGPPSTASEASAVDRRYGPEVAYWTPTARRLKRGGRTAANTLPNCGARAGRPHSPRPKASPQRRPEEAGGLGETGPPQPPERLRRSLRNGTGPASAGAPASAAPAPV